jgi:uncharacterized LabA/DUF88 family protein
MSDRIIIFIDGSNFYHGLKKNIGIKDIDFLKFGNKVVGERKLIETYYYNAPLDINCDKEKYWKQQEFFEKLKKIPNFKLVLVGLQKRIINGKPIYIVKGDDIHLATDLIVLAYKNAYDVAILVSGDGDFVPAIKAVQELGKRVENYYFKIGGSWHLRQICDKSVLMDKEFVLNIQ